MQVRDWGSVVGRQKHTVITDHDIVEQMIPPAMLAILGILLRKYVLTDVEDFLELDRTNSVTSRKVVLAA